MPHGVDLPVRTFVLNDDGATTEEVHWFGADFCCDNKYLHPEPWSYFAQTEVIRDLKKYLVPSAEVEITLGLEAQMAHNAECEQCKGRVRQTTRRIDGKIQHRF